jgi:NAD(P)-dependent dehydrogenase (short-subunit alcohol dehydrogenase family)
VSGLLADKVAVVTGASSGNGRAIARAFADHGAAAIVVADVRESPREGGEPTHRLIEAETASRTQFVRCDVSSLADLDRAIEVAEPYGGVDVMVNNAGIYTSQDFLEVTEEEYDRMMAVNVKGVFFGSQVAARRMVQKGGGTIINLSSVAGLHGSATFATYCTSKGAVRLMTYALAGELGPQGVRVNAIHPGLIETQMTIKDYPIVGTEVGEDFLRRLPSRRYGQPAEVADAAVYLASDLASYINGASLVVDGGMTSVL